MVASLLLSRVLGLVRDMVIANKFGAGPMTDAYTLAFQLPDLIFYLIAGGALSSAFIPVFSEYLHTNREKEAWQIFSSVATITTAAISALVLIAFIFAGPLIHLTASGAPAESVPLIVTMSRIVLPAQIAFFVGGLMIGTLYSLQRFAVPGLGPNIYNLGIIFGATVLSTLFHPNIIGMACGALLGACVGSLVIPAWEMKRAGGHFKPSFSLEHPGVKRVFTLMIPVIFGLSLAGVYPIILRSFASHYVNGPSYIYYSNLLMQAPIGILGQSLAIAVFPALSQFYAEKRMDLYRRQIASTMRTVIYLTLPISGFMALASLQVVRGLYEHGKFSADDATHVTMCLQFFCIGITAWCLHPVITRGFFAIQNSLVPTIVGTIVTGVFIGTIYALKSTSLGLLSLPLASSLSAILLTVVLTAAIIPRIGGLDVGGILLTLLKSVIGTAFMLAVTWVVLLTPVGNMSASHRLIGLLIILLMAVPGMFVYLSFTKMMKMPEAAYLDRVLARITGGRYKAPPKDDDSEDGAGGTPPYEPPGGGSIDPMEGA